MGGMLVVPLSVEMDEPRSRNFLEKLNPKATWLTVVWASLRGIVIGLLIFWLFFKPEWKAAWPFTLPPWLLLCAFVFAIFEWQVPDDDDLCHTMETKENRRIHRNESAGSDHRESS
jgi:hypothetical protein